MSQPVFFDSNITAFSNSAARPEESSLLSDVLKSLPDSLGEVARDPAHEVQILFVQIDETEAGVNFTEHGWRLDADRYFYPASTVKFPVALFALEKLAALKIDGLTRETTMLTDVAESWQTERLVDSSAHSGMPSIAHDLRRIFLVSDNDSFNRLYEFVGAEAIHHRTRELGRKGTRIFHRLSVGDDRERGRFGNPIRFLSTDGHVIHSQAATLAPEIDGPGKPIRRGQGYLRNGELIKEPMDFSNLNSFPLREQHLFMRDLFFPAPNGLTLGKENRAFLQDIMGQYPRENQRVLDDAIREKPDLYLKNFLRWMAPPVRDSFRCYNKSGLAYGYLTDNAYLVDREKGVSFFLAATIHVNDNGIYNDDVYEYEKTAEPFMAELAKAIYQFELKRSRK